MKTNKLPLQSWKPRSYQEQAVKLMVSQAAAGLFLDPGLGKTSITFAAFRILRNAGYVKKMLVIAPLRSVYMVWPEERSKWFEFNDLRVHVLHGKGKDTMPDADAYIINPEGLDWVSGKLGALGVDMLVVDESTKFKHTNTQRFKMLKALLPRFKRRYILTGTPTPNGLMDLFGQVYILDQGNALGRFITKFRNEYFFQTGYGGYTWSPKLDSMERVTQRVAPLVLRMKAEDYLDMPELIYNDIYVQLPAQTLERYRKMENDFFVALESDEIAAANAAVASGKLRQIANGALYTGANREFTVLHREKVTALADLVEQLAGSPLLVLYEFDFDREMIQKELDCPALHGGTSPKSANQYINDFNEGKLPVLIGHPGSMGHGLNLQGACHHVCWYGLTWNLEYYDQATRRVYRQGQQSDRVFVYRLAARDTIDEVVLQTLAGKDRRQAELLSNLERYRRAQN